MINHLVHHLMMNFHLTLIRFLIDLLMVSDLEDYFTINSVASSFYDLFQVHLVVVTIDLVSVSNS